MPDEPVKSGDDDPESTETHHPRDGRQDPAGEDGPDIPPTVLIRREGEPPRLKAGIGDLPREIPVRLGKYLIEGLVGRGAMGVVYKARQPELNRVVALKLLIEGTHATDARRHRFEREARSIAKLNHPNIVAVHEVGDYEGQPFFTMDFVDGMPLDTFIEWNGITSTVVLADLAAQIADAVHYAHERGIVHRDLKPSNILVNRNGRPIVTDFGLAKDLHADTLYSMTGDIMGTPAYMAPEQATGQVADLDFRADIYSMGALLYAMLTGSPPFEGKTLVETLGRVINEEPKPLHVLDPSIDADLGAICLMAMEKDPKDRYETSEDLSTDLRSFINGGPIKAQPWNWRRSSRRIMRKHRRELQFAAIALIGIGIAALVSPIVFSRSYLDIATAHMGSGSADLVVDTVTAVSHEIEAPDQLAPEDVPGAARLLWTAARSTDEAVQIAFLDQLKRPRAGKHLLEVMTDDDVAALIALADQPDRPAVRNRTIEAMARVRKSPVTTYLIGHLNDPNPVFRNKVIRSVGAHHALRALQPLMRLMIFDPVSRPEAELAVEAFRNQGRISLFRKQDVVVKGALHGLSQAMAQYNEQLEDLEADFAGRKDLSDPLYEYRQALERGTVDEKHGAIIELGRIADTEVYHLLLGALPDEEAGLAAAYTLSRGEPAEVHPLILRGLSHESPIARAHAAHALALTGHPDAMDQLVVALRNELDIRASTAMVQALGELERPEAIPHLRFAVRQDNRLQPAVDDALDRVGAAR